MTGQSKPFNLKQYAETPIADLLEMLTTMRPAGSAAESAFNKRWILPLGATSDAAGNRIIRIGDAPVLWSCHTDTVHRRGGKQRIQKAGDLIRLHPNEWRASCLGADCTTGVWLMREMILASVPGLYVFHAGEEVGGLGSSHIACKTPQLLDGILYAVAFDRKGKESVITHQFAGRCCSTAFAVSLAGQLPGAYCLDGTGSFTDTANYVDIIPECSNISVGYERCHTQFETQSISHATRLRRALLQIDSSEFACERDSSAIDPDFVWAKPKGKHCKADTWLTDGPWAEEAADSDSFLDGPYTYPAWYEQEEEEGPDSWKPRKYKY
jgi:hypothetical protein